MKLILYSIICVLLLSLLSSAILGMAYEPLCKVVSVKDAYILIALVTLILTMLVFFSIGLHIVNKLCKKSKKKNTKSIKY